MKVIEAAIEFVGYMESYARAPRTQKLLGCGVRYPALSLHHRDKRRRARPGCCVLISPSTESP